MTEWEVFTWTLAYLLDMDQPVVEDLMKGKGVKSLEDFEEAEEATEEALAEPADRDTEWL